MNETRTESEKHQIPRKIYLQWVGDADEPPCDTDAIRDSDVTWSRERIFKADIVYVSLAKFGRKRGKKSKRRPTDFPASLDKT